MAQCRREHTGLVWPLPLVFRNEPWITLFVDPPQCRMRVGATMTQCDGIACFAHRVILLNVNQEDDAIPRTLWHEINHAAIGSGIGERIVARAEQGLYEAAKALGASLPPLPRGFYAMRERARWGDE